MCQYDASTLLCYLDNRSAVGVMAHNMQHNNRSLRQAGYTPAPWCAVYMRQTPALAPIGSVVLQHRLGYDLKAAVEQTVV